MILRLIPTQQVVWQASGLTDSPVTDYYYSEGLSENYYKKPSLDIFSGWKIWLNVKIPIPMDLIYILKWDGYRISMIL